jgi:hypothetical protein
VARIVLSIAGTLLGTTMLFAHCSADRITGPTTKSATIATGPRTETSPPGGASGASFPYNGDDINPCDGQPIPVKGSITISLFNSSTDISHFKWQMHWVMDGTDLLLNVYHGDDQYLEDSNVSLTGGEETFVQNVNMHSSTAPDYQMHMQSHILYSATGDFTATVDKLTSTCSS